MRPRRSERIEYLNTGPEELTIFNLSKTGVSCLHSQPVEPDTIVKASINNVSLDGKIIYSHKRTDGYRVGMQFWKVNDAKQKELDDLVDKFSRGVPLTCTITKGKE